LTNILFVCTGNIFRSVTAEYSLKRQFGPDKFFHVSSAGTMDAPGTRVRDDVSGYLLAKGLDVSQHRRRTITDEIIQRADVVIAMNTDHMEILKDQYATNAQLYMEACGITALPLPDVDDLFDPNDRHGPEAKRHIRFIIDKIIDVTPLLASRLSSGLSDN